MLQYGRNNTDKQKDRDRNYNIEKRKLQEKLTSIIAFAKQKLALFLTTQLKQNIHVFYYFHRYLL